MGLLPVPSLYAGQAAFPAATLSIQGFELASNKFYLCANDLTAMAGDPGGFSAGVVVKPRAPNVGSRFLIGNGSNPSNEGWIIGRTNFGIAAPEDRWVAYFLEIFSAAGSAFHIIYLPAPGCLDRSYLIGFSYLGEGGARELKVYCNGGQCYSPATLGDVYVPGTDGFSIGAGLGVTYGDAPDDIVEAAYFAAPLTNDEWGQAWRNLRRGGTMLGPGIAPANAYNVRGLSRGGYGQIPFPQSWPNLGSVGAAEDLAFQGVFPTDIATIEEDPIPSFTGNQQDSP